MGNKLEDAIHYSEIMFSREALLQWAANEDNSQFLFAGNPSFDANGLYVGYAVRWPDGSGGTFTALNYNATHELYDGYSVTHTNSGGTFTQPAITRDADGLEISRPAMIIS